jgi:uncharacterized membrane protein
MGPEGTIWWKKPTLKNLMTLSLYLFIIYQTYGKMVYSKLLVMNDKTYDIACNDIMKIQQMSEYRKCKKINTTTMIVL